MSTVKMGTDYKDMYMKAIRKLGKLEDEKHKLHEETIVLRAENKLLREFTGLEAGNYEKEGKECIVIDFRTKQIIEK